MKLDRNINGNRRGKYALLKLRRLTEIEAWDGGDGEALDRQAVIDAIALLERAGILDWGYAGTDGEFMVMRLKDKHSYRGLMGYLKSIELDDEPDLEYAQEILDMAKRAGPNSPWCKRPD